MAILHSTHCYAVDEHGVPLGVTAAAFAQAEVPHAEVRHALDAGAGLRFVDGAAIAEELAQAHRRIGELQGAQERARAARPPSQPAQRPATSTVSDALYAQHAASCSIFPSPTLSGAV